VTNLFYITDRVYLFGGWDGSKDLADFWVFNSAEEHWSCISTNTQDQVRAVDIASYLCSMLLEDDFIYKKRDR